jgi:SAM-dependent methyltransferase
LISGAIGLPLAREEFACILKEMAIPESLGNLLEEAARFHRLHRGRAAVRDTFGYFTDHPVAPLNQRRLSKILELSASSGPPRRILDLACGAGLTTQALATLGPERCVGVDLESTTIQAAREFNTFLKRSGRRSCEPLFFAADLTDPEVSWETILGEALGGRPDAVVLAYALHHFDPKFVPSFLERLNRWLDPGAIVVINEENPWSPAFRLKHVVRGILQGDTEAEHHLGYSRWRGLMESAGFAVGNPVALDPTPLAGRAFERLFPGLAWSLVFAARRS